MSSSTSDEDLSEHIEPVAATLVAQPIQNNSIEIYTKRINKQLVEIIALYRKLHIELDDSGRSSLIVQLYQDPRIELRELGFELADRDLSGRTELSPEVGEYAKNLLLDSNPLIRSKAARLINRLVPLDAMIVITDSLTRETDPIAAEPMLNGITRWPNPDAVDATLGWFMRDDSPFASACSAVWSLEQASLIKSTEIQTQILERLRRVDSIELNEDGMKLFAKFGDANDLQSLVSVLLNAEPNQQQWAANALVETPRAAEVLIQVAENNSSLFEAASESLITHRRTPEGLRRLASLPFTNQDSRKDALSRMGAVLADDRLAEAVRLAELSPENSTLLLNRLLSGNSEITPRMAKGIILLAEIELNESRPNRAFEAAIALDNVKLDPVERTKINLIKSKALVALGKLTQAHAIQSELAFWLEMVNSPLDKELRIRVAQHMLNSYSDLPVHVTDELNAIIEVPTEDSVNNDNESQSQSSDQPKD
ncbi:MAG: hypothetical protein P1U42_03940 [Phycisphaerales bacterium]|nr:hypothetical protein [Phycisphaerales bacterium]